MNCVGNNRPVSEWSDDKTLCAAQVLVLIGERDISDGYPRFVYVFLEVKATLFQPLKVIRRSHVEATLINSQINEISRLSLPNNT